MRSFLVGVAVAASPVICLAADTAVPVRTLSTVTVIGSRPTSLPTQIPTTIEGISGEEVHDAINATDSEDALKYFPSLLVRKRYIGDYDHAVLGSRASGTNNSARSLVYADGILLSNLLGNGATFTPRWGMVTPEEIDRVEVLYGPFSAAYPGNSVGAVVDYVTRMPEELEGHVRVTGFGQRFDTYGTDDEYAGFQGSVSLGDRNGGFSWWLNYNRLDSDGQPIAFANKLVSSGTAGSAGVPVTGAIPDRNPRNQDWLILGSTNQIHTVQDHAKLKLAYDFTPTLRVSYTFGTWINDADRKSESYLRNAAGESVDIGIVNIDGRTYSIGPADFAPSRGALEHRMHGLSLRSHGERNFGWELAASRYDYVQDTTRSALPAPANAEAGRITDQEGTGWDAFAAKGSWHPGVLAADMLVEFGYQRDRYRLRTGVFDTDDWQHGNPLVIRSAFRGETQLEGAYVQDSWRFANRWRATVGLRAERWRAGETSALADRDETDLSPKAALSYEWSRQWTFRASAGRAVRYPTVAELYQGSIANTIVLNDPDLRAEKSWTNELTAERHFEKASLRSTVFHESTSDALYSQTNVTVSPSITNIQNVDRIRTTGAEFAYIAEDVLAAGLSLTSSLTYAHSRIVANDNFPASVGKWQPRVPEWRANFLATYRAGDRWIHTLGVRYSGRQYNQLDNSDPNGRTYTGTSSFLVADWRTRYRFDAHCTVSLGIDNLNDERYWAFHPYTRRTVIAEMSYDF